MNKYIENEFGNEIDDEFKIEIDDDYEEKLSQETEINSEISNEITVLKEEQIFGKNKSKIFEQYGNHSAAEITDFAILLGGAGSNHLNNNRKYVNFGCWWTSSFDDENCPKYIDYSGEEDSFNELNFLKESNIGVRPVLAYSAIKAQDRKTKASKMLRYSTGKLIKYGEYPQKIVDEKLAKELEEEYQKGLLDKTGKNYSIDYVKKDDDDDNLISLKYEEFDYKGKDYIRKFGKKYIRMFPSQDSVGKILSDNRKIVADEPYWISIEPINWILDWHYEIAMSEKILFAGIQFGKVKDIIEELEEQINDNVTNEEAVKEEAILNVDNVEEVNEEQINDNVDENIDYDELKFNQTYIKKFLDKTFLPNIVKLSPAEEREQFKNKMDNCKLILQDILGFSKEQLSLMDDKTILQMISKAKEKGFFEEIESEEKNKYKIKRS